MRRSLTPSASATKLSLVVSALAAALREEEIPGITVDEIPRNRLVNVGDPDLLILTDRHLVHDRDIHRLARRGTRVDERDAAQIHRVLALAGHACRAAGYVGPGIRDADRRVAIKRHREDLAGAASREGGPAEEDAVEREA